MSELACGDLLVTADDACDFLQLGVVVKSGLRVMEHRTADTWADALSVGVSGYRCGEVMMSLVDHRAASLVQACELTRD